MSSKRASTDSKQPVTSKHKKFSDSEDEGDSSPDPYKDTEKSSKDSAKSSKPEPEIPDVKSFNDWEHADLGTQDKKAKFLRLMGAAKVAEKTKKTNEVAEKSADIVFGLGDSGEGKDEKDLTETAGGSSQQHRDVKRDKKLVADLEREYKHSMDNHLKMRDQRHRGLGWNTGTEVNLVSAESKIVEESSTSEPPKPAKPSAAAEALKAKYGAMKFVSGGNK